MELANRVYVFCPEVEKGIMFYDQSPNGALAELTGTLPEGKFWSSGESIVEWNEETNGKREDNVPVTSENSFLVHSELMRERRGSFGAFTIIVSKTNLIKLLAQIDNPVMDSDGRYHVINLNSRIYDYSKINGMGEYPEIDNKKPRK